MPIFIDNGGANSTAAGAITSGTQIWTIWNEGTATGAVTGTGTTNHVWRVWTGTNAITNTAATTGNGIWQHWIDETYTPSLAAMGTGAAVVRRLGYPTEVRAAPRRTVSPEERAAHEARERELQAKLEAEREFRRVAEAKAEILLQRLLNPEQRETLKEKRCFYMYSKGKKYRIDRGQHGNVKLLDAKDQIVESYCIQPRGGIPDADAMAAQKLLLEADPETFVRVANITRRDGSFRHGTPLRAVG